MNPAIPISIITLLAFAAMAIYLITTGLKIRFPRGREVNARVNYGATKLRIFIDSPERDDSSYARIAGEAMSAVVLQWETFLGKRFPYPVVVIHFTPTVYKGYHGIQTWAKARIGKKSLPMLVIEDKSMDALASPVKVREGSLVVHEAAHLYAIAKLGHPDVPHADATVWAEQSSLSFEGRALADFVARVEPEAYRR